MDSEIIMIESEEEAVGEHGEDYAEVEASETKTISATKIKAVREEILEMPRPGFERYDDKLTGEFEDWEEELLGEALLSYNEAGVTGELEVWEEELLREIILLQ